MSTDTVDLVLTIILLAAPFAGVLAMFVHHAAREGQ